LKQSWTIIEISVGKPFEGHRPDQRKKCYATVLHAQDVKSFNNLYFYNDCSSIFQIYVVLLLTTRVWCMWLLVLFEVIQVTMHSSAGLVPCHACQCFNFTGLIYTLIIKRIN